MMSIHPYFSYVFLIETCNDAVSLFWMRYAEHILYIFWCICYAKKLAKEVLKTWYFETVAAYETKAKICLLQLKIY